jgi:hypothetical protein
MRAATRRLLLGSGPLERFSDRVQALARLLLVVSALVAVPAGIAVGLAVSSTLHAGADQQAAARQPRTATLLAAAPFAVGPAGGDAAVTATWAGVDGRPQQGPVVVPSGSPAGSVVRI